MAVDIWDELFLRREPVLNTETREYLVPVTRVCDRYPVAVVYGRLRKSDMRTLVKTGQSLHAAIYQGGVWPARCLEALGGRDFARWYAQAGDPPDIGGDGVSPPVTRPFGNRRLQSIVEAAQVDPDWMDSRQAERLYLGGDVPDRPHVVLGPTDPRHGLWDALTQALYVHPDVVGISGPSYTGNEAAVCAAFETPGGSRVLGDFMVAYDDMDAPVRMGDVVISSPHDEGRFPVLEGASAEIDARDLPMPSVLRACDLVRSQTDPAVLVPTRGIYAGGARLRVRVRPGFMAVCGADGRPDVGLVRIAVTGDSDSFVANESVADMVWRLDGAAAHRMLRRPASPSSRRATRPR